MVLILLLWQMNKYNESSAINFLLIANAPVTNLLRDKGCVQFTDACNYVAQLTYKRNVNKENLVCIIDEQCGTCSTKHALLKRIAEEHEGTDIQLIIGIFLMTAHNTPKIAPVLQQFGLYGLPEAHCYLMHENKIYDYTFSKSTLQFQDDLLQTIVLKSASDISRKQKIHQAFIGDWITDNNIQFTYEEIWGIRERCIEMLSVDIAVE